MESIYSYTLDDISDSLLNIGYKKFHSDILFDWLYIKRIKSFNQITNLKKELIEKLNENYVISTMQIIKIEREEDTYKYLFRLYDNEYIEAVYMKHNYGNSLCISTQIGCNISCAFCESGRLKKLRDLTPNEMIEQILLVEEDLGFRITHLVLMGIGEPFDNYDNVIKFIDIINHPKGLALGSRHITISTSGIIPKINEFAGISKQVNLAISLHASNDSVRDKLIPINKVYPISELIKSVKNYIKKTNRRVTFEYIMLDGINDKETHALELSKLLKGINCYVNLIPYNETSYTDFKKSNKDNILKFYDILKKNKINVTIRKEFGSNLSAACGQLRSDYKEGK